MPEYRSAPSKPVPLPSDADRARGRLMQGALQILLNRVRGARDVLPHLAALEVALGRHGVAAISGLAPQWVPKMYSQLSSLPIGANEPLLLDLQQRLFEALPARPLPAVPPSARAAPPQEYLSNFDNGNGMLVGEASHTDFMREIDAV